MTLFIGNWNSKFSSSLYLHFEVNIGALLEIILGQDVFQSWEFTSSMLQTIL